MIKVSGLRHKKEKQSNPRLTWFMFQKVYIMYRNTKKREERNAAMILTSMQ